MTLEGLPKPKPPAGVRRRPGSYIRAFPGSRFMKPEGDTIIFERKISTPIGNSAGLATVDTVPEFGEGAGALLHDPKVGVVAADRVEAPAILELLDVVEHLPVLAGHH